MSHEIGKKVNSGVGIVVMLVVVLIVTSFVLVPVGLASLQGTSTDTLNQSVGETVEVTGNVNATLDSTSLTSPESATITLNDTDTADSTTKTINNGTSETYSLQGGDINVSVENVESGYAISSYEYSTRHNLGGGTSTLIGIVGLVGVLALVLLFIGVGVDKIN